MLTHRHYLAISTVALAECLHGVEKSFNPDRNRFALNEFLRELRIVPFDARCADRYGWLRAQLEREGRPIDTMDLMIGASALVDGATLVTHNVKHFERIPGLNVEDWLAEAS